MKATVKHVAAIAWCPVVVFVTAVFLMQGMDGWLKAAIVVTWPLAYLPWMVSVPGLAKEAK